MTVDGSDGDLEDSGGDLASFDRRASCSKQTKEWLRAAKNRSSHIGGGGHMQR